MKPRVHILSYSDINWPFDDGKPYLTLDVPDSSTRLYVDPFPCYPHDPALVHSEVAYIESVVKLPFPPHYFSLPYETLGRTNGWADGNSRYTEQDEQGNWKTEPNPYIVLSGKRIPIHPSMTRYLIAHEFGHVVHSNLAHLMEIKYDELKDMYAKDVRKIECIKDYGALKWHKNIGEIIANDVRIALFGRETEFWPHEVEYTPNEVVKWWKEKAEEFFK